MVDFGCLDKALVGSVCLDFGATVAVPEVGPVGNWANTVANAWEFVEVVIGSTEAIMVEYWIFGMVALARVAVFCPIFFFLFLHWFVCRLLVLSDVISFFGFHLQSFFVCPFLVVIGFPCSVHVQPIYVQRPFLRTALV